MKKRILALIMACSMAFIATACSSAPAESKTESKTESKVESKVESEVESEVESKEEPTEITLTDREGVEITVPTNIEKIVCVSATSLKTLINLGLGDKIIGIDTWSIGTEGVSADIPAFDMMNLDMEALLATEADIIIGTGMSAVGEDDPYKEVRAAGTVVTSIPAAASIEDIKKDIQFLGDVTGCGEKATEIIDDMTAEMDKILDSVDAKGMKVYFEIAPAPDMYSLNDNTFIGEILNLMGMVNVFGDSDYDWVKVSEETLIASNPDIIFTTSDYIPTAVEDIKARSGWDALNAVKNNKVYLLNSNNSNQANENIVKSMQEIADYINNAE